MSAVDKFGVTQVPYNVLLKCAEVDYTALTGLAGAGLGAGIGAATAKPGQRGKRALIGGLIGGATGYGGAKTFQHFYQRDTDNYLRSNLKRDVNGKDQWVLDTFNPNGTKPGQTPAFMQKYPNESLFIDAHGHSYLPGNYRYRPHNPLTGPGSGMTDWMPDKYYKNQFSLEDLAKHIGPENVGKIKYFGDMACKGSECAYTPADILKHFPNVQEVVMHPKGSLGLEQDFSKAPRSPYLSQNPELMEWLRMSSNAPPDAPHRALDAMVKYWTKDNPISRPMRYVRGNEGWSNMGAFNLQGKDNNVTTPFIFDNEGVLRWLKKTYGEQPTQ